MEIVFDGRSRIKQERINLFLKKTAESIRREKVDFKFLKSEEFSDHLEDILIKASNNHSESKREHFKNILVVAIHGQRPPDLSRLFLNILNVMIDDELILFAYLCRTHQGLEPYSGHGQDAKWFLPEERIRGLGLEPNQFRVLTLALASKGLISFDTQDEAFGQFAAMNWSHSRITPMGLQFYGYLVAK